MDGSGACVPTSSVLASDTSLGKSLSKPDRVVVVVAGLAALFLVPWTVYIGNTLHHPGFWVAIDSMEAVASGATAVLVARQSRWAPAVARMGAIVLVLDAYTDITSAHRMGRLAEAVAMAVLVELPLAAGGWIWAGRHEASVRSAPRRRNRTGVTARSC